jgi:hypothetical protein
LIAIAACQASRIETGNGEQCLGASARAAGNPVGLVSCPIDVGEDRLEFFVGVRNLTDEPLRVRVRLEPFNEFQVQVRERGGDVVSPAHLWEPASIGLERSTYLLPRGGVLGRVIDLACLQPDFGRDLDPCAAVYELAAGEFEIQFEYEEVWVCLEDFTEPCEQDPSWTGTIEGATHSVSIR